MGSSPSSVHGGGLFSLRIAECGIEGKPTAAAPAGDYPDAPPAPAPSRGTDRHGPTQHVDPTVLELRQRRRPVVALASQNRAEHLGDGLEEINLKALEIVRPRRTKAQWRSR
jgi:hypothetical protein